MGSIKVNDAPFGSNVPRFGIITVHPNLDPSGLYTVRPKGCDPSLYSPHSVDSIFIVNKDAKSDTWEHNAVLEESQNLGFRNDKILRYKKYIRSIVGPEWHNVTEPFKYQPSCKNVGFGRKSRFTPLKNQIPGPGTYYKSTKYEIIYGPHSKKPSFERESPCRFKDLSPKWNLAPNRYAILDKDSIEMKPTKVVSKRGPYDLFTGTRDDTTKNHFNTSSKCTAATWPLLLSGTFEKYKKTHFGVFNKTNRDLPYRGRIALIDNAMSLRRKVDPGPADTNIVKGRTFKLNRFPFNSSFVKPRGYQRVIVWPGVGRYNNQTVSRELEGQGHRHVLKVSKAEQLEL